MVTRTFLLLVVVLIAGCVAGEDADTATDTVAEEHEQEGRQQEPSLSSCGAGKELFNISPLSTSDFTTITPLGNLAPSAHTFPTMHTYWEIRKTDPSDETSEAASVPVYAPSDITIVKMSLTDAKNRQGYGDYAMEFQPCKEFVMYFDHLKTVSPTIKQAFDAAEEDFCEEYTLYYASGPIEWQLCKKTVSIEVKAGELIGTAGGDEGQRALDMGAYDFRIEPHTLANPNRWKYYADGSIFYVVCPLDYFTPEVKRDLESRLGGPEGRRTIEPLCGTVVQDVPGTAQGNWVPKGTGLRIGAENEFLALVHDNFDPRVPAFSIGTAVRTFPYGAYYYTTHATGMVNRDFSDVVPGGVYCFEKLEDQYGESVEGIVLLQLASATELKIEKQDASQCGSGPWSFTSQADVFER